MKVKLERMEEGVLGFLKKVADTLPSTGHRFAAGAMLAGKTLALEKALGALADDEGAIETDEVRTLIRGGFRAAGEKATFTIGSESLAWLLKPVNISVCEADLMTIVDEVETAARR